MRDSEQSVGCACALHLSRRVRGPRGNGGQHGKHVSVSQSKLSSRPRERVRLCAFVLEFYSYATETGTIR